MNEPTHSSGHHGEPLRGFDAQGTKEHDSLVMLLEVFGYTICTHIPKDDVAGRVDPNKWKLENCGTGLSGLIHHTLNKNVCLSMAQPYSDKLPKFDVQCPHHRRFAPKPGSHGTSPRSCEARVA